MRNNDAPLSMDFNEVIKAEENAKKDAAKAAEDKAKAINAERAAQEAKAAAKAGVLPPDKPIESPPLEDRAPLSMDLNELFRVADRGGTPVGAPYMVSPVSVSGPKL